MRCKACNVLLTNDSDLKRKEKATREFIDLCSICYQISNVASYNDADQLLDSTDPRHCACCAGIGQGR